MTDSDDDLVSRLRQDYARLPSDQHPPDVDALALSAQRRRRRRRARVTAGVVAVAVLAAVGVAVGVAVGTRGGPDAATDSNFAPAPTTYDGPLDADGRFGAAGKAVNCLHPATGMRHAEEVYAEGATSDTPAGAVETAYSEGLFLSAPGVDLALAAKDTQRQLLTYEVDGRVLMALLLRDGPAAEGTGGDGWYVEAYARCDYAEFPADDARAYGYLVWTDGDGAPVPVAKVYSGPGPEHCDWQDMTFLHINDGGRRGGSYVEAPEPELRRFVAGPYRTAVALPAGAKDTGWERDGKRLWLSADGKYVYVGSAKKVAAWPRFESSCA